MPKNPEEPPVVQTLPEGDETSTRREFLLDLKKWSKSVIALALFGVAVAATEETAEAQWFNHRPPWQNWGRPPWQNWGRPPWHNQGRPPWHNHGRPPWHNHGRPPWVNRQRPPWHNGGGWLNRGRGSWVNYG